MRKRNLILAAASAAVVLQSTAMAAINIDGAYDADYGAAITLQTNNTGFGDNSNTDGATANGNELDAAYAVVQNGNLNLLFTGNLATDFTHLNVFIADGRPGQSTINAESGSALAAMNGSKFSPGFAGTYALDINGNTSSTFVNQYDMTKASAPSSFFGSFTPGSHSGTTLHGVTFSLDNSNTAGVDGSAPSAADQNAAAAVQTGMEISIPLSQLGSPSGESIEILADINGGGNGFLSNQFLTGLPTTVGNVGGTTQGVPNTPYGANGTFDFSSTNNMFFLVNVPASGVPSGVWKGPAGGSWADPNAWNGVVPNAASAVADFGSLITGAAQVNLDGDKTVGKIIFNNANSYTIAPGSGGAITLDDTGDPLAVDPTIDVQLGNHTIQPAVVLANGVTVNTGPATSLTMSGNITGSGDLSHTGDGQLVLGGSNSFAGNIISTSGTVQLNSTDSQGGATVILGDSDVDRQQATLALGAAITNYTGPITTNRDLSGQTSFRTLAAAGNVTVGSTVNVNGGLVFAPAAGTTLTFTGILQNAQLPADSTNVRHGFRVNGGGTVIFSGSNNLTVDDSVAGDNVDTSVDSGTLILSSGVALPSTLVNVFTNGVFVDNGLLPTSVHLYAQGQIKIPGNTDPNNVLPLTVGSISVDNGGSFLIGHSASSKNPVFVDVGQIEFLGGPNGTDPINGQLDITNNQMRTTNDQDTVRQQLLAGNILTTAAGGTVGYKDTGDGHTLMQFALGGDADLNNSVDTSDFMTLSQNFGATGVHWADGDFNYDGVVNALDFNAIASNYGKALPAPALGSVVPEPTALCGALMLVSLLGAGRRRRKHQVN